MVKRETEPMPPEFAQLRFRKNLPVFAGKPVRAGDIVDPDLWRSFTKAKREALLGPIVEWVPAPS